VGALCQPSLSWGDNSACPGYDKCGLTFAKGCVKCPVGMNTDGCICSGGQVIAKKSYGRGAGSLMTCPPDKVEDASLCYPPCPPGKLQQYPVCALTCELGSVGDSFICWEVCPSGMYDCGGMCADSGNDCVGKVKDIADEVIEETAAIAECAASDGTGCNLDDLKKNLEALLAQLAMPLCGQV